MPPKQPKPKPNPKKAIVRPSFDYPVLFPYVTEAKIKKAQSNPAIRALLEQEEILPDNEGRTFVPDTKLKPLKKYFRPSFSPYFNSWIIDFVWYGKIQAFLFILNENTRFLIAVPTANKSANELNRVMEIFLNKYGFDEDGNEIELHVKGDGEKAYGPMVRFIEEKYDTPKFKFFFRKKTAVDGYQLTNSYSLIDSVVRTIRDLIARVSRGNPLAFADPGMIDRVVKIYNNTVHSAYGNKYTPTEVQNDFTLEAEYIRKCEEKLKETDRVRRGAGLLNYKPGNILLVHIPTEKTGRLPEKRRRNFDELAKFVRYDRGNAIIEMLNPYPAVVDKNNKQKKPELKYMIVPVFYTRFLATTLEDLHEIHHEQFPEGKLREQINKMFKIDDVNGLVDE